MNFDLECSSMVSQGLLTASNSLFALFVVISQNGLHHGCYGSFSQLFPYKKVPQFFNVRQTLHCQAASETHHSSTYSVVLCGY